MSNADLGHRGRLLRKIARKTVTFALHPHYHSWNFLRRRCNICGRRTVFLCDEAADRWIRRCLWCRSTPKYRAIVWALEQHLGQRLGAFLDDPAHRLYELTTTSPVHRCHRDRANYVCSGYFSDRPFKTELQPGIWNEDVQDLHFPDASFDIVISSETMEHVRRPWLGFRELQRVLKPGGVHVFTIPFHPDQPTTARVDTTGAENRYLLPKIYHQDPYRTEDSLVYTDYGHDLPRRLEPLGFRTRECLIQEEQADIQDDLRPMRVFLSQRTAGACA